MESYLAALGEGVSSVFSWPGILIPIAGTLFSMVTAFLPGIGGSSVMALIILLTLNWDPISIMLLFGALTGGATFMGSITAILFNIPGTASSAAALLDGYPMGRNGYPRTAIACAATASAIGSVVGVLVLLIILPFIRDILLEFGPIEFVLLGVWGLTTLSALPKNSTHKSLVMAMLGFIAAMIGSDPTTGIERWSFGSLEIYQGVPFIPALLGLFTISEIINWSKQYHFEDLSFASARPDDLTWAGVRSVFQHYGLTIRSAVIGTVVGIIPGIGGTVASFVAYGQAAHGAGPEESKFGEGDIRGLIAPEAAVDSKDGGALLPVIAFGLPGSENGVILVAVLAIHGIVPGVPMLAEQLPLTMALIFALLFSNLITSVIGVALSPALARLKDLRVDRIALPLLVISLVGIVHLNSQLTDIYIALGFGFAGFFFLKNDWPRVPFIIALVLGEFIETNASLSVQLIDVGRLVPYQRPTAIVIFVLIMLSIWWMFRKRARKMAAKMGPNDRLIACVLLAGTAVFAVIAYLSDYSTMTLAAITALFILLAAFLIKSPPADVGNIESISASARVSLLSVIALPFVISLIGIVAGLSLLVFVWLFARPETQRHQWRSPLFWAIATGVAVQIIIGNVSHLTLPPGVLWDAL